jgi:hypothetical protein
MFASMASITHLLTPLLVTRALEVLAVSFPILLLLLFVALILQKIAIETAHRRRAQALQAYREELHAIRQGQRATLSPPQERFERQALAAAVAAGGEAALPTGAVAAALRSCGIVDVLKRDAVDEAWGQRYAAYEALGKLGLMEVKEFLFSAASRESDPRTYAASLTAAARLAADAADLARVCEFILKGPVLSSGFNEGVLRSTLRALLRLHGCVLALATSHDLEVTLAWPWPAIGSKCLMLDRNGALAYLRDPLVGL